MNKLINNIHTNFKLFRIRHKRERTLSSIKKELQELRKFEAQGIYPDGVAEGFVDALKENGLAIDCPPMPKISWLDRYIVPVS